MCFLVPLPIHPTDLIILTVGIVVTSLSAPASSSDKVPARTYGRLTLNEAGRLVLTYRPWLVLPARALVLPEGKYFVGKGAFFTEIQQLEADDTRTALLLPPRYRGDEEKLVSIYGLTSVRPIGLNAMWEWLKESLGFKEQPAAA